MQVTKLDTLIALIQWRIDEGIPLKDAYNTVVRNFHEGVTEDERQQLLEHFIPNEDTTMNDTNTYDYQDDDTLNLDDYTVPVSDLSDDDVEELLDLMADVLDSDDDDLATDIEALLDNLDNR